MDMRKMLAQAQMLQKKLEVFKKEVFSFNSKDGLFTIAMNGNRELINLVIDEKLFKEIDDLEMVSDMLKVALNNALNEIEKKEKKIAGNFK